MTFETSAGSRIIVGSGSDTANRWNSVNADNECLTGVYGVYTIIEEDEYQLLSIGFYFGDSAEENAITGSDEDEEGKKKAFKISFNK